MILNVFNSGKNSGISSFIDTEDINNRYDEVLEHRSKNKVKLISNDEIRRNAGLEPEKPKEEQILRKEEKTENINNKNIEHNNNSNNNNIINSSDININKDKDKDKENNNNGLENKDEKILANNIEDNNLNDFSLHSDHNEEDIFEDDDTMLIDNKQESAIENKSENIVDDKDKSINDENNNGEDKAKINDKEDLNSIKNEKEEKMSKEIKKDDFPKSQIINHIEE